MEKKAWRQEEVRIEGSLENKHEGELEETSCNGVRD